MRSGARLIREKRTMEAMVRMYCHAHHSAGSKVCAECGAFLEIAFQKIEKCPFHELKPVCADCRIHCYRGETGETARTIMRYSGPRMVFRHPVLALFHVMDKMKAGSRGDRHGHS